MSELDERFKNALTEKHIPILILDNKWHRLFGKTGTTKEITRLENELKELLKRQGKLNDEMKRLKTIKNNLMSEIVSLMENQDASSDKKVSENKRLINEVNDKLASHEDEMLELPREIDRVNRELMLTTMQLCYGKLEENTREIEEIAGWIRKMRVELKRNIISKQQKEINNAELYSYMHDIFGSNVLELFDMKYEPTLPSLKKSDKMVEGKKESEEKNGAS